MPAIYVHLKANDLGRDLAGRHLALYWVIRDLARVEGIAFEERLRDRDITVGTHALSDGRFEDGNLHILDDRSVQAPGVLNAAVAYLWEFWQLDPSGLKAFSSTVDRSFNPTSVSPVRAQRFRDTLWQRYVVPRKSKNTQNQAAAELPDNALALFFQGDYLLKTGASDMSDLLMLDSVQKQAGERPIVVKPHPSASAVQDIEGLKAAARHDPRIHITDANVHDILERASATVSMNSTVALEGFLHAKPAILFGQSDFHHIAGRVHRPSDFGSVLSEQLDRNIPYDAFLAWFFLKTCIPLRGRSLSDRIWQQFAHVGFAKDRFVKA